MTDDGGAVNLRQIITDLARGYTRGEGFDGAGVPKPDLAAVIGLACLRIQANPSQMRQTTGPYSVDAGFVGWTLSEQVVLNRYRRRAM